MKPNISGFLEKKLKFARAVYKGKAPEEAARAAGLRFVPLKDRDVKQELERLRREAADLPRRDPMQKEMMLLILEKVISADLSDLFVAKEDGSAKFNYGRAKQMGILQFLSDFSMDGNGEVRSVHVDRVGALREYARICGYYAPLRTENLTIEAQLKDVAGPEALEQLLFKKLEEKGINLKGVMGRVEDGVPVSAKRRLKSPGEGEVDPARG
jgi:hypothetical protein